MKYSGEHKSMKSPKVLQP